MLRSALTSFGSRRSQALLDLPVEAALREELAEGVGGGGEAAGHADARGRERADHLPEGGILAADLRQVGEAKILEPSRRAFA